jgi:PKD domain-containing protein
LNAERAVPRPSRRRLAWLVSAIALALALGAPPPPRAAAASCERMATPIFDGGGYVYDFRAMGLGYGAPLVGGSHGPAETPPGPVATSDAWRMGWGNVRVYPPGVSLQVPTPETRYAGAEDGCSFALDGQEIAYPVVSLRGLEVQHRWYVDPGPLDGARILTVLRNPGSAPVPVTVVQGDPIQDALGLGSDDRTVSRATSDGTGVFSPSSAWGVTTDEKAPAEMPDPALAHVWDGPGGAMRASEVALGSSTFLLPGLLYWDWNVTVPPGGVSTFISYEIQAAVPGRDRATEVGQAVRQAEAREGQSPASLYVGMSAAEIAATMNWPLPAPTAAVAPVGRPNAATPLRLDGGASAPVDGLPQCATDHFAWKADDGATGSEPVFSHLFAPGRHSATLTVSNDCGGSKSAEASFRVAKGLRLGGVKLNRRAGTARLKAVALGPGRLTLSGRGVRKAARTVRKAGGFRLLVKPSGAALRKLVRSGRAKVRAKVSLKPPGAVASTATKKIVLRAPTN